MVALPSNHDLYELKILEEAEAQPTLTNRKVASKLGVSVRLAHELLGKMVSKGLFHVKKYHARRWDYFLTPKGIAEKARLTVEFVDFSMQFYRQARCRSAGVCRSLAEADKKTVAFLGATELAEICILGVQEWDLDLCVIYSDDAAKTFMRYPIRPIAEIDDDTADAIIICLYDPKKPTREHHLPPEVSPQEKMHWIF